MKKLQNNYTTPEQSKQLLELGVPEDSADCAMFPYDETFKQYELRVIPFNKKFSTYEIYNEDGTIYPGKIPCWSGMQLMEIIDICSVKQDYAGKFEFEMDKSYIQNLIYLIIGMLYSKDLDFSKFEK